MHRIRPHLPILLITLAGLVMRLWNAGTLSLNNDELSALYRLQFDSLGEVWQQGVRLDGHPALVQTFLWFWLRIVPQNVFFLRLPFVMAGTASLVLVYALGKSWFGKWAGLFATATLAFMEFPILYSQLARPYAFGLFFITAMAWCWWRIVAQSPPYRWYTLAGAVISTACCFYTHYFCFFSALLLGTAGLTLIRGRQRLYYIGVALAAGLLFLPHLSITLYQLGVGGVGGWLGKPGYEFPINYLLHIFNRSPWVLMAAAVPLAWALLMPPVPSAAPQQPSATALRLLCLACGLTPMAVGFMYSRKVNPVLQYSVLLFSLPFLLLFIFSFAQRLKRAAGYVLLVLYSLVAMGVTILPGGNNYYGHPHFGEYRGLAIDLHRWKHQYADSVEIIALVNNPFYLRYYFGATDPVKRYYQKPGPQLKHIRRYISTLRPPHLGLGWTNQYFPPELPEMIGAYYPYTAEYRAYVNAGSYLFSRQPLSPCSGRDTVHQWRLSIEHPNPPWAYPEDLTDTLVGQYLHPSAALLQTGEFGPSFTLPAVELMDHPWNIVHARVTVFSSDTNSTAQLVMSIERHGKTEYWTSRNLEDQALAPGWTILYLSERMSMKELQPETDVVKIYVWKPGGGQLILEDMCIWVEEGNPHLYGYP